MARMVSLKSFGRIKSQHVSTFLKSSNWKGEAAGMTLKELEDVAAWMRAHHDARLPELDGLLQARRETEGPLLP